MHLAWFTFGLYVEIDLKCKIFVNLLYGAPLCTYMFKTSSEYLTDQMISTIHLIILIHNIQMYSYIFW